MVCDGWWEGWCVSACFMKGTGFFTLAQKKRSQQLLGDWHGGILPAVPHHRRQSVRLRRIAHVHEQCVGV